MSLYSSLSIGRQALQISQIGLQITAQNIANVNTQGYKRQRVEQANLPYGLGVTVQAIDRIQDTFAEKNLLGITSDASCTDLTAQAYAELESLFNEMTGSGLESEFSDFFAALHDLAARPGGTAERAMLRSRGESLSRVFNFLQQQMTDQIKNQDLEIQQTLTDANELIRQIGELNKKIGVGTSTDVGINELKNTRDECVRKLAEIMPVTTTEDVNGNFTVYIKEGMPLVSGTEICQLKAEHDVTNDLKSNIIWVSDNGVRQDVTAQMTNGSLGGALLNRDVNIPEQITKLDRLAAEITLRFNEQHRAGVGLDGVGDRNFFEPLSVFTHVGQGSTGGASVTAATVLDESALTLDDYAVRLADDGMGGFNYTVVNETTGATAASGAYVSGAAITFDGISVTLTDATGPPVDSDFFRVNTYSDAAKNIRVSSDVEASLDAIAAGLSAESGDNRNALNLADLENKRVAANGTMSFTEMYQAMVVELGVAAGAEKMEQESNSALLSQATNMVESVSGVNIDDEAVSLMQYQHAYQAAAKVISTVDEMLKTLVDMI